MHSPSMNGVMCRYKVNLIDLPPVITVHVLNFRVSDISDLTVTHVDGELSPEDRLPLQETVEGLAGRFPLKESIAVSFNVNNGFISRRGPNRCSR